MNFNSPGRGDGVFARPRRLDAVFVIARESLGVSERFRDPFFRAGNLPSLDADQGAPDCAASVLR